MSNVEKALETQLGNIQTKTGRTLDQIYETIRAGGRTRHGEIREFLKQELSLGFGDANTLANLYLKSAGASGAPATGPTLGDAIAQIYAGPKASLLPIHERVMSAVAAFGPFESAPKKSYISLRRKKQFAMVGPATKTRVDIGLNLKGVPATSRLVALPPGGMCQYKVGVASAEEVDAELTGWLKQAYDAAG
jgi:hypothetical protein